MQWSRFFYFETILEVVEAGNWFCSTLKIFSEGPLALHVKYTTLKVNYLRVTQ